MSERFADGLVGIVLDGRYRLDAVLGEGGMGSVFRAHHLQTDRRVAVKLLKPHLTTNETQLERFVREARSTMKVESPHAVKCLDFGITPQKDYYMVLEYLDGRTVQRELEVDGPFAPARAVHVIRQTLHALGAAHATGLVHRDLKPDNVLLMRVGDDPDFTKLLDFGVAKLMEGAASSSRSALALTQQGTVFGTPEFMSPEQACGHPLDGRSDLYSIAATLFAMLTGCGLFEALTPLEWLTHHVRTPAPHLGAVRPELARYTSLDAVLQNCLAKKPDQRPPSAAALDALLAQVEHELDGTVNVVPAPAPASTPTRAAMRSTMFSPSTFIEALPEPPMLAPTPTGGVALPTHRGKLLAISAFAIVAVVVVAIVVATRDRGKPVEAAPRAQVARAAAPPDAMAPVDATIAIDAAPPPVDAAPHALAPPNTTPVVSAHLANAEAAHRANNHLRQLAEADLALRADPRSARAKFLLGDALISSGDLERGCKYLRALNHSPEATNRARAASCPSD